MKKKCKHTIKNNGDELILVKGKCEDCGKVINRFVRYE